MTGTEKCEAQTENHDQTSIRTTYCWKPAEVFVIAQNGLQVGTPKAFCNECHQQGREALKRFVAMHPNDPSISIWSEVSYEEYLVALVIWS